MSMAEPQLAHSRSRVSVLVPSYNHAPFIARCLRSIIRQTPAPAQLLVIDDGSTDGSAQIIEQVLKECTFPCELIARKNRGLCATLNEGLVRTSGDYFAYLGSDDIWLDGFVGARRALLDSRPSALLVYGHAYLVDEQDRVVDCSRDWANSEYVDGNIQPLLFRGIAPVSPTVMYRRSALEKHGWNKHARLEDYELYLRLSYDGEFALDPAVLAAWRQHGYNTSADLGLMLDEVLEAQTRTAALTGIGAAELERMHRATRFHYVEDFTRRGQKLQAFKLLRENLSGARSLRCVGRVSLRLLLPQRLLLWRKRLVQQRNRVQYGALQV